MNSEQSLPASGDGTAVSSPYPIQESREIAWISDNLDNALASSQRRRYLEAMLALHQPHQQP